MQMARTVMEVSMRSIAYGVLEVLVPLLCRVARCLSDGVVLCRKVFMAWGGLGRLAHGFQTCSVVPLGEFGSDDPSRDDTQKKDGMVSIMSKLADGITL